MNWCRLRHGGSRALPDKTANELRDQFVDIIFVVSGCAFYGADRVVFMFANRPVHFRVEDGPLVSRSHSLCVKSRA